MASWQFQCVCCGVTHAAPLRPEGLVYLRCGITRKWAWYEPSSFFTSTEPKSETLRVRGRARVQRAAAGRRTRTPARGSRRTVARKAARPARKRR